MGLFSRKSREERAEEGMRKAEDIVAGRGLTGRLAKGFIGSENAAQMGEGLQAARDAQAAAAVLASGEPPVRATVTGLADTGKLINFDPVVVLTATLEDGQAVSLQTLVSKLQIPRVGDAVNLVENPGQPGTYVYGGLAV